MKFTYNKKLSQLVITFNMKAKELKGMHYPLVDAEKEIRDMKFALNVTPVTSPCDAVVSNSGLTVGYTDSAKNLIATVKLTETAAKDFVAVAGPKLSSIVEELKASADAKAKYLQENFSIEDDEEDEE